MGILVGTVVPKARNAVNSVDNGVVVVGATAGLSIVVVGENDGKVL